VAYVVPAQAPTLGELRGWLQAQLPAYMMPSTFVALEALPLTPNGKVDRRALPTPDQARPALDDTFVAPCTPAEVVLARIWADVLRLEQVGVHDNFFALGGHSLLATQVISRVRSTFRVELPLRSLFEAPTVAELATAVVQRQTEQIGHDNMASLLVELEELPDEKAHRLLADESGQRGMRGAYE
jgi:acyl carrier protein